MKKPRKLWWALIFLLFIAIAVTNTSEASASIQDGLIIGLVMDSQNQPVNHADILLELESKNPGELTILYETETQPDGSFAMDISPAELAPYQANHFFLLIKRSHFTSTQIPITQVQLEQLISGETMLVKEIVLDREINLSFWIATTVFIAMLVIIAIGKLHNTLSALVGASGLLAISYLGHPISESLYIFEFSQAISYIDWNVIFLIMGMMIVIAVIERTGLFQWLAFMAYRMSAGRTWVLLIILMIIAGIASAFLDNVTTMLLMTPISVQIAISLGINPLALLVPEVFASNVIGISTLIGTPTNILIGSYGKISFTDFLTNLTPGVLLSMVGLIVYSLLIYRKELQPQIIIGDEEESADLSKIMLKKLEERAKITQPVHLKRAGVVGAGMLALFVFGEQIHLLPAVTALIGATALLLWIRPDMEEMIEAVDWTTLVFFMSLFICVGAVQEVGLISYIADFIGRLVGTNLTLAMISVIWLSAILSTIIANIPFTAAMLPVIGYLTGTLPGASSKVLFYCLSVGSAMGGNGSLIGASANMVTAGIAERAGYSISYLYFLRKGFPALVITVALATVWLLIRF